MMTRLAFLWHQRTVTVLMLLALAYFEWRVWPRSLPVYPLTRIHSVAPPAVYEIEMDWKTIDYVIAEQERQSEMNWFLCERDFRGCVYDPLFNKMYRFPGPHEIHISGVAH